ncbi:DUF1338 domain-containing protein [Mesorhizobium sp. L-8-10]|uniref:2-oxoadipate dioxygenase/decarboxylase HglS n=1 Tax=Mesorhizobium sp. L-8-10 TaxID=2744523 RepID=UPI0019255B58|nr:VOC family protein [Mesorhizobium sp. L-8-10]BCH31068.1 DUF1338 domain-containing protein [Mesorhizobium sp. L-8-10]
MPANRCVSRDEIRAAFSAAMSAMYRAEVPAYGTLISLVTKVNAETLSRDQALRASLEATETIERISEERHGAIRLGTAQELAMMRRVFAVMGMLPVGYYDLSEAGVPVHSTAFRPIDEAALKINPFRVFTSLLRLDLIDDAELREEARRILAARRIFSDAAVSLVEKAERDGGLSREDAGLFVLEVLDTFRWHDQALVDRALYERLHAAHRLIADVVSFRGPHINHLTPRTLDIDAVQERMPGEGIAPKAIVEGPPTRACPVLLRQTSFKAIEERVSFRDAAGDPQADSHTARFGEIEQRGIALTPKGRALYDRLLRQARATVRPAADGSNADAYRATLAASFEAFPDDWNEIRKAGLGYFLYTVEASAFAAAKATGMDMEDLIEAGVVRFDPIVYEDFLPVSAAGIFQSNLGDHAAQDFVASPNQRLFEQALGAPVANEFQLYADMEKASAERCLAALREGAAAA